MESFVYDLVKLLPIPMSVMAIIMVIYKIRPVSFFTSSALERKLYSKEGRVLFSILLYVFKSFVLALAMLYMINVLTKRFIAYPFLFQEIAAFGILTVLMVAHIAIIIAVNFNKKIKDSTLNIVLVLCYFATWFLVNVYYFAGKAPLIEVENMILKQTSMFIVVWLFNLFYPMVTVPVFKLINFVGEQTIYFLEDSNSAGDSAKEEKWYLLYPIGKKEFLVGDQHDYESCNKTKIIRKDDLIGKVLYKEDVIAKDEGVTSNKADLKINS